MYFIMYLAMYFVFCLLILLIRYFPYLKIYNFRSKYFLLFYSFIFDQLD